MRWKIIIPLLTFIFGILVQAFITPLGQDIYKSTIGKIFFHLAKIELYSVSNTTLEVLNKYYDREYYYEITSFKIENRGTKATKQNDQLRIQARGEILGITPKELNQKLKVDKNNKSIGYLNIGLLSPGDKVEGEIHSFSNIQMDRNESQIGFDRVGNYKFFGPKLL